MAVKTKLTDNEFAEILSNYHLGKYINAAPITQGAVQTNFLIQTTKGKYVFRYYENRSKESVLFESNLIHYLADKNYPCPALYKNKHGKYVGSYQEKPYVILEFIEGQHLENPNEAQKKQLIKRVAELQKITRNYRPRGKKYRWNYDVELCRELAQQATQKINTANASDKLVWYNQQLADLRLPASLPRGICHCDFHFSNILFKDGEFNALIDFDDANYTYLTFDLATLIDPFIPSFNWDTWSQFQEDENVFDFTESRNVISEYMKHRPLSPVEKRHLFDVFKLSIMLDCIWFYERGNACDFYEKRKINHLNGLGRENFYKALFSA